MRVLQAAAIALALSPALVIGQAAPVLAAASQSVEFELMTWPEVKAALAAGKTTALFYTGGTEQRGPQNANGGHNLMARATVKAIAEKLGNAIAMPVLPYTPNNASAELPGTIGLTPELLGAVLERISEQAIQTGFKNVVIMGDHGGGQPKVYQEVAKKLDAKYAPKGIHVFYCDDVYIKAGADFDKILESRGYPASAHGGITDTSLMMYLDKNNEYVRKELVPVTNGDPVPKDGQKAQRKINNGILGDPRRSTAEIGKEELEHKVNYAVKQIQSFIPPKKK
jgi:creatinine amidohydrolase/Fe(II)-dependent formamide hydrolase-like protein